jgi:hypothetical protein
MSEENKSFRILRRNWEVVIKMYPTEIGSEIMDWIKLNLYSVQYRAVVNTSVAPLVP